MVQKTPNGKYGNLKTAHMIFHTNNYNFNRKTSQSVQIMQVFGYFPHSEQVLKIET